MTRHYKFTNKYGIKFICMAQSKEEAKRLFAKIVGQSKESKCTCSEISADKYHELYIEMYDG